MGAISCQKCWKFGLVLINIMNMNIRITNCIIKVKHLLLIRGRPIWIEWTKYKGWCDRSFVSWEGNGAVSVTWNFKQLSVKTQQQRRKWQYYVLCSFLQHPPQNCQRVSHQGPEKKPHAYITVLRHTPQIPLLLHLPDLTLLVRAGRSIGLRCACE